MIILTIKNTDFSQNILESVVTGIITTRLISQHLGSFSIKPEFMTGHLKPHLSLLYTEVILDM